MSITVKPTRRKHKITKIERWELIPGFPNYQASTMGRVRFTKNPNQYPRLMITKTGYYRISLSHKGLRKKFKRSVLVAMTFLGHRPNGFNKVVDHKDNVRTNDKLCNQQVISQRQNKSKDRKNKTSKYTGVCWDKVLGKWKAQISTKGKVKSLGYHFIEEDARDAYLKELNNINNE